MANLTGKGGFVKGQSGNPYGYPGSHKYYLEAARAEAINSLKTLVHIRDNKDYEPDVRRKAACDLLDRSWGKPAQRTELELGRPGDFERMQSEQEILDYISRELGSTAAKGLKMIVDKSTTVPVDKELNGANGHKPNGRVRPTLDE